MNYISQACRFMIIRVFITIHLTHCRLLGSSKLKRPQTIYVHLFIAKLSLGTYKLNNYVCRFN